MEIALVCTFQRCHCLSTAKGYPKRVKMNVKIDEALLVQIIGKKLKRRMTIRTISEVGGGCINSCFKITVNNGQSFFVKANSQSAFPSLLEKEQKGLAFISKQNAIRVPEVIDYHIKDDGQFLILEWIEPGDKNDSFWKMFGQQLAALHKIRSRHHGFAEDNYMGALQQSNVLSESWTDFFTHQRLEIQVQLAFKKGFLSPHHLNLFERLYKKLDSIFNEEDPSLLHGDLWSGNFIAAVNAEPVLIDPAVYFGHRNMDLGMTTLFGGFDQSFYDSYQYHFPLASNYRDQWAVCNLYPLLIHLNLFGAGYRHDIEATLKKFAG